MFKVKHKGNGSVWIVYGFSGIRFLLWNAEAKCWKYDNMENYCPLEEENEEKKKDQII